MASAATPNNLSLPVNLPPQPDVSDLTPRTQELLGHLMSDMEEVSPRSSGHRTAAELAIELLAPKTKEILDSQDPIKDCLKKCEQLYQELERHKAEFNRGLEENNPDLIKFHQCKIQSTLKLYVFHCNRYKRLTTKDHHVLHPSARYEPPHSPPQANNVKNTSNKHKIMLCKYHIKGKLCFDGGNCSFAHGKHDQTNIHVRKIAEMCFHGEFCRFGINCKRYHSREELNAVNKQA